MRAWKLSMALSLLVQSTSSLGTVFAKDTSANSLDFEPWDDPNYPLVEWLRNKHGGFVSDKIELRSRPMSSDDNAPIDFGWFATADIPEGEVLMIIPSDAYIDTYATMDEDEHDNDDEDETDPLCTDIAKLVAEYQDKESAFYTLASFILDEESPGAMRNRQPGFWSREAKGIFWNMMLDEFLQPDEGDSKLSYREDCGWDIDLMIRNSKTKQHLEDAFQYFMARTNGNILFPLYDLVQHRNGKWRNVELKREWNGRILVKAFREIPQGGQLYKSFNRCDFEDGQCESWDDTFIATQDILKGTGQLEDYPRRWIVIAQPGNDDYTTVFDLDKTDDGTVQFTWKSGIPNLFVFNFMTAHLEAFKEKEAVVKEQTTHLKSSFERDTILHFLEVYSEAFHFAWLHRNGDQGNRTTELDPFEEPRGLLTTIDDYFMCYISRDCAGRDFDNSFVKSHYQTMKWKTCPEEENTCLTLDSIIQSCTSFRPHYHESFVHIPAQYAKQMKRVAFLGGGDNLLLHEIFKYPDLEKVVGLELDQSVVRHSFKFYGASPYFNDPRMEWWFGDASKSFLALPKEYFGSFDLVIVDLLSFIADTLKVTDELTLMDAAGLLMKPDGGVIVKQEDFAVNMVDDQFARYTTKMLFEDLPFLCEQTITMGSNSVDFFSAPRYDHGIETFVREEHLVHIDGGESALPFPAWKDYFHVRESVCQPEASRTMTESIAPLPSSRFGVLLILEAEELTLLDSIENYFAKTEAIVTQLGLSLVDSIGEIDRNEKHFVLLLREGYIIARPYPPFKYIGFDVMLWDDLDKLESVKQALIAGFGGSLDDSTSSFRIVSSGMSGVSEGVCQKEMLSSIADDHESRLCRGSEPTRESYYDNSIQAAVIHEFIASMVSGSSRLLIVLCGEKGTACLSLEAAEKDHNNVVVPVFSCSSTLDDTSCRTGIRRSILDMVTTSKKVDGIIVDPATNIHTCQLLHTLFLDVDFYGTVLEQKHMALASIPKNQTWRSTFVDRFRTELGAFFSPSHRADFRLINDDQEVAWSAFVSGCDDFFSRIADALASLTAKTTWLHSLDIVESGEKRFIVDFTAPKTLRDRHYNKTKARKHWSGQVAVGYQTVVQMEQVNPRKPFQRGERVLVNTIFDGPWDKMYEPAIVMEVLDNGESVLVEYEFDVASSEDQEVVKSTRILRAFYNQSGSEESFNVRDVVLYDTEDQGKHYLCMVSSVHNSGETFDLAKLGIDGNKIYNVSKSQLMHEFESPDLFIESPLLAQDVLLSAFDAALRQVDFGSDDPHSTLFTIGTGIIAVAIWSNGNAVLKWNGETRVELSLYLKREDVESSTNFRNSFAVSVGNLATVMLDEFPRGYGQIVSFPSHMAQPPHWLKKVSSKRNIF